MSLKQGLENLEARAFNQQTALPPFTVGCVAPGPHEDMPKTKITHVGAWLTCRNQSKAVIGHFIRPPFTVPFSPQYFARIYEAGVYDI